MANFRGNTFVGQRMQLDGHDFTENVFQDCVLVYGGGPLKFSGNVLTNVKWEFVDSAARSIALLSSFYQSGGEGRKFVEFVLSSFGESAEFPKEKREVVGAHG